MVTVTRHARAGRWLARSLRERADRMLHALRMDDAELSVVLVSNAQIRRLNRRYLGLDRPTDVLSFPMHGRSRPPRGTLLLGDVVISTDMVRRQAREDGATLIATGERLLIHGLLHLLGHDHEVSEAEARRMARREQSLAASIRGFTSSRR
jgi:rRNA maturation RNase YbeY